MSLFSLSACQTAERKTALLVYNLDTETQERQLLQDGVSTILNGVEVTLGRDAFVMNSEISVEKINRRRTLSGVSTLGRNNTRPYHLRLWLQGESCLLEYIEEERTQLLPGLTCISE